MWLTDLFSISRQGQRQAGSLAIPFGIVAAPQTALIAADPFHHEVLVFYPAYGGVSSLRVFDLDTQTLVAEETLGVGFGQPPDNLFRAGRNLIAGRFDNNYLALMRTAVIPMAPPADLALSMTVAGPWRAGSRCDWFVTVINRGPNTAPAARVDLRLPPGMYFVRTSGPAEPIAATEPNASLLLGDLAPGQEVALQVTTVAQTAALSAEIVATTRSAASDPQRTNNVAQFPVKSVCRECASVPRRGSSCGSATGFE